VKRNYNGARGGFGAFEPEAVAQTVVLAFP